jgi:acetyltransferase
MIGGPGFTIGLCSPERLRQQMDSFVALLQDAVEDGASVGYLPPLSGADARAYWETVCAAIAGGARRLIAAEEGEGVLGAVQLDLPALPNARHRGEVMKLIVHRLARRRGVGRALMQALEHTAAALNRTLLVLDTRKGDAAERLYASLGYRKAGVIPRYAMSAGGTLDDTVYMYRELGSVSADRET